MLVLHGSWIPGRTRFCLWAEIPQEEARRRGRKPAVPPHPFAAPVAALTTARRALFPALNELDPPETIEAWLPASGGRPQPSPELLRLNPDLAAEAQPGELARFALPAQGLTPLAALDALLGLPRPADAAETGIILGSDLLILERGRQTGRRAAGRPAVSAGHAPAGAGHSLSRRLAACARRAAGGGAGGRARRRHAADLPGVGASRRAASGPESALGPRALLTSFLETIVDRAVRAWLPAASRKTTTAARALPVGEAWVAALHADDPTFSGSQAGLAQLHQAWRCLAGAVTLGCRPGFPHLVPPGAAGSAGRADAARLGPALFPPGHRRPQPADPGRGGVAGERQRARNT